MSAPFLQKYTPRYLRDFQFDTSFLHAMQNLLTLDFLNILFIGNIGTGKTSIINALITEYYFPLNNHILVENDKHENYYTINKNKEYMDKIEANVLYINNLCEQGISYYRSEVKTFCQTACTIPNKKKILVLDDLDMVNIQSQQVFRNCIDSYGSNIHCIASCTNTQKVINSIQSRTTIIHLYPLSCAAHMNIVNYICEQENIDITPDMKHHLIRISDNSTSMLINYLEKCKLVDCKITKETVEKISTNISYYIFDTYTNLCIAKKSYDAIMLLYNLFDKGYSIIDIFDSYFCYIKQTDSLADEKKYAIICFISNYITIFYNTHEDEIELAVFTKNIIDVVA
jgi:DNA polymerase III delta prime subunit